MTPGRSEVRCTKPQASAERTASLPAVGDDEAHERETPPLLHRRRRLGNAVLSGATG